MKSLMLKRSTLFIFILSITLARAQNISNTLEIERNPNFETLNGVYLNHMNDFGQKGNDMNVLSFSENFYVLKLFEMKFNQIDFGFDFRLEDELPYVNKNYVYTGFYYFDFTFNYTLGNFDLFFSIENLLGWSENDFSITPEVVRQQGVYNELQFNYDPAFLVSTGVTFNF